MANHFRLYGRPLMADEVEATLTVTGVLDGYTSGEPYEGRLQINNSIGRCTVEIVEADLPSGATVHVDNFTKEVVVRWPAFEEVVAEETVLPNGSFESGDNGTWTLGPGWSIGSGSGYDTHDGTFSARFANVKTQSSDLRSPIIPAKVKDHIRVKGYVQQGASSKGNAGARVSLSYHDKDGKELQVYHGNYVSSGKKSRWHDTVAEGAAPKGTAGVMVRFTAFRKKQNHPLWVDNLTWDHKYTLGQNDDEVYFLHIKVTDSLNRVAYWQGNIEEHGVFLTSQLYPFYFVEALQTVPSYEEWRFGNNWRQDRIASVVSTPSFVEFVIKSTRNEYATGESVMTTPSLVSLEVRSIRREYSAGYESVKTTPSLVSFTIKAHPKPPTEVASVLTTPSFVSWSTS